MIQLRKLNLSFSDQKVFDDLTLLLHGHEKIGLVGLNGSGKSTLLKAIAGMQELDSGIIELSSRKKIGYMPQEVVLNSTKTVIDEVLNAITIFDETEVEALRAEIKKILMGLGFSLEQMEQSVCDLSVGWRMRVVLAQLLMQKADFYLFDEPTNHLDIVAKEWFLQFLKKAKFGFLLVCHERYFLDHLCTNIFELELGKGTLYTGNYSAYLVQKEERKAALLHAYEQQQRELSKKQATIDRFKAGTRSTAAKSMQKMVDKIERIEIPPEAKRINAIELPPIQSSGRIVLTVHDLGHTFGTKKIFDSISFTVERYEKVAIIAANGVGKTTLLTIVAGKLPRQQGSISLGHNVKIAFFEQDQVRALDPKKTILETIQDDCPRIRDHEIRTMLGNFLFTQDLIHKKTSVLSGGERNRVSMVRVLLQQANFLMLDEPTNHLDMPSKDILLHTLQKYPGTILFVSHDQDFINNLATHIIELTPHGAYKYTGNYDSYLDQKNAIQQEQNKKATDEPLNIKPEKNSKELFEQRKESRRLEQQIEKCEQETNKLSLELAEHAWGTAPYKMLYEKISTLQKKHTELLEQWEQVQQ